MKNNINTKRDIEKNEKEPSFKYCFEKRYQGTCFVNDF